MGPAAEFLEPLLIIGMRDGLLQSRLAARGAADGVRLIWMAAQACRQAPHSIGQVSNRSFTACQVGSYLRPMKGPAVVGARRRKRHLALAGYSGGKPPSKLALPLPRPATCNRG